VSSVVTGHSNCAAYQLTTRGYRQMLINGKILRSAYAGAGKLLPGWYRPLSHSHVTLKVSNHIAFA